MIVKKIQRLKTKVAIAVKSLFSPVGVVGPHLLRETWEEQYSKGAWDHLEDEKEIEHYVVIADFFRKYIRKGSVLDIGCGTGLLYKYMQEERVVENATYLGVDISEVAVDSAKERFGKRLFSVLDYQKESIGQRFDCIIFNETLYYFNNADKTLNKSISDNLVHEGKIIISMVEYDRHDLIWKHIDATFNIIEEKTVGNANGTKWTIKIISKKS